MGQLRDLILAADDLPKERVETPEWAPGVPYVYVRGLTAAERDQWEQSLMERMPDGSIKQKRNINNLRAAIVARVVIDEDGNRVFEDKDIDALGGKSAAVLDRLWDAGRGLSGMAIEVEENPSKGESNGDISSDSVSP